MSELNTNPAAMSGLDWPEAFIALGFGLTGAWTILLAYGAIQLLLYAIQV
jgi:hypothetical protein